MRKTSHTTDVTNTISRMASSRLGVDRTTFVGDEHGSVFFHYEFDQDGVIGSGSFSDVFAAYSRVSNEKVAVKRISRTGKVDANSVRRESGVLRQLDHPHIIKLIEMFSDARYHYLVQEMCEGGELFTKLRKEGKMSESESIPILKNILSALWYMHKKGICHRDLKLDNILFVNTFTDSPVKLVDFGYARVAHDRDDVCHHHLSPTVKQNRRNSNMREYTGSNNEGMSVMDTLSKVLILRQTNRLQTHDYHGICFPSLQKLSKLTAL
eukprot:GHVR01110943.1.p1 GENE.GHVR01110943.1~~GHVR01110943.1.p1  ORF type:complete len:267 (+),score=36.55 GHVR01110943.1:80-880(+)